MRHYRPISAFILLSLPIAAYAGGDPEELFEPQAAAAQPVTTQVANTTLNPERRALPLQTSNDRVIELYASDDTAEALYEVKGPLLGLRNDRASASFLISEERDNILAGSVLYDSNLDIFPGLSVAFGTKAYIALLGPENNDVFGVGVSVEAGYLFPVRQFPLYLSGAFTYAPDILTFGQADRVIDWHARAALPLTDNIDGFVGFRFLQFEDTLPGDREVDEQLHIGVRWALGN